MDDELETGGSVDPALAGQMLSQLTQRYTGLDTREAQARQLVERTRADRLREAEEKIRAARFGMPSRSEQLFALSASLLAPKPYQGLAGTLANVIPTLSGISSARRDAEEQRQLALMKMREQYAGGDQDLARIKAERESLVDLMKIYGPLAKPKDRRTGFNPVSGRLQYMDTGESVAPPLPKIGEVRDGYQYIGGNPAMETSWQKVQ